MFSTLPELFLILDYPAPSILKTEYIIKQTGSSYSQMEVIPGTGSPMYATLSFPMQYELVDVSSKGTFSDGGASGDYDVPEQCTSGKFTTAPKKFFCLNKETGKIYTTSAITGQLEPNSEFEIVVRISNTTIFPVRDVNVSLKLTSVDRCENGTIIYKNLTNCVQYLNMNLVKYSNSENSYLFKMPKNYQRIVALKVPLLSLQASSTNTLNLTTRISGLNDSGAVVLEYETDFELYYTSGFHLYLNTPISYKESLTSVKVIILESSSTDEASVVASKITDKQSEEVSLLYIKDFKCEQDCVQNFAKWKKAITTLPDVCQKDRLLYGRNLDVCTGKLII